jgi:hypothetical protein
MPRTLYSSGLSQEHVFGLWKARIEKSGAILVGSSGFRSTPFQVHSDFVGQDYEASTACPESHEVGRILSDSSELHGFFFISPILFFLTNISP